MAELVQVKKTNGFTMFVNKERVPQLIKEGYEVVETKEVEETKEEQPKTTTRKRG